MQHRPRSGQGRRAVSSPSSPYVSFRSSVLPSPYCVHCSGREQPLVRRPISSSSWATSALHGCGTAPVCSFLIPACGLSASPHPRCGTEAVASSDNSGQIRHSSRVSHRPPAPSNQSEVGLASSFFFSYDNLVIIMKLKGLKRFESLIKWTSQI